MPIIDVIKLGVTYRSVHCEKCLLFFYFPVYAIERGTEVYCPLCKEVLLAPKKVTDNEDMEGD